MFPLVAPRALSVAQDGGIVLAGVGSSDVFDGGSSDPNAAALPVWFVAAFDGAGRPRWSRRMASRHAKVDVGHALGADCIALPGGRAACAGYFAATLELADGELLCEGTNTCAFVATLDEHGDVNWSTTAPSPTALCENWTATISTDDAGDLVVVRTGVDPSADSNGYCRPTLDRFDGDGHLIFHRALPGWMAQASEVRGRANAAGDVFVVGACNGPTLDGQPTGCDLHQSGRLFARLDGQTGRAHWAKDFWWSDPVTLAPTPDGGVLVAGQAYPPHPGNGYVLHPEIEALDAAGDARFSRRLPWPVDWWTGGSLATDGQAILYASPQHAGTAEGDGDPPATVELFALDGPDAARSVLLLQTDTAMVALDPSGRAVLAAPFTGELVIDGVHLAPKNGALLFADFAF